MRTIVAMIGVPAVGKSTITRKFMNLLEDWEWRAVKHVPHYYSPSSKIAVLGKYDDGEVYPGTDRLGLNVQPHAKEWIESNPDMHLFFEGDRIGNQSMFEWITELPDTQFHILHIKADDRTIHLRHRERNDSQNEQFLRGRETKIEGICRNFVLMDYIKTWSNEKPEDSGKIATEILNLFAA